MGKIVAIGGGDLSALATEPIDRAIIELSGKSNPHALFIPTASSDSVEYWETFDQAYRVAYGCDTDVLYLLGTAPDPSDVARKIERADIVYVGGGNTLKMMRRWRRLGVDVLLREAHAKGAVLCGVSAGAICWFDSGHSDSMSFYHPKTGTISPSPAWALLRDWPARTTTAKQPASPGARAFMTWSGRKAESESP